ncbi:MAG: hypothetical protein P3A28_09805 [Gemmatimonadota bacterium]|nr:hypothetical protein [Gemmatimonadota bacterium]
MPLSLGCRRTALGVSSVLALTACGGGGPPARIVVGISDTVVVHSQRPTAIPAEARDAEGLVVAKVAISYRLTGGDSIPMTSDGTVTCTRHADAKVTATAGALSTVALVRCRPIRSIHMNGPVQFIAGDTAQPLVTQIVGLNGEALDVVAGSVAIDDRAVAGAEGMRITAREPGAARVTLTVGDSSATADVNVYEPLDALVRLRPEQKFVAVRLSLRSGEYRRWTLPAGTWMLTMLPYKDEKRGIRLKVAGASCVPEPISPRRISCTTADSAYVTVEHPSKTRAPELEGQLLVRRI